MFYSRGAAAFVLVTTAFFSSPSYAWGPEGHAIVAEIAEARLKDSPAVLDQIKQLLASDDSHAKNLDQIASWADAVRPSRPETENWHFVDIPLDSDKYDASRDCKQTEKGDCVVAAIQRSVKALRDRSVGQPERVEALKFLVHFVGDIHQPLHAENDCSKFSPPECDRGGNKISVSFRDRKRTNLHAVWDGGMIEDVLQVELGPHFQPDLQATAAEATKLNKKIPDAEATAWAPQDLIDHLDTATIKWAEDSHRLAQTAYQNLPTRRKAGWEDAYEDEEWDVVETQLEKAGVRLAEILKEALQ